MMKFELKSKLVAGVSAVLVAGCFVTAGSAKAAPPAPKAAPMMHIHGGGQNAALDFDLSNHTGYAITELWIGKSGQNQWTADDEVTIPNGSIDDNGKLHIYFSPKQRYDVWDIYVKFEDGITAEFDNLDLTTINKISLHYNADTKETTSTLD